MQQDSGDDLISNELKVFYRTLSTQLCLFAMSLQLCPHGMSSIGSVQHLLSNLVFLFPVAGLGLWYCCTLGYIIRGHDCSLQPLQSL